MKVASKECTTLSAVIESIASSRNIRVEEINENGKFAWKLMSGSQIGTEIIFWNEKKKVTCVVTPLLVFDEYEIYLPTSFKIESDITSVSDWLTSAIIGSLEKSDQLLEIVHGATDAFHAAGYSGEVQPRPVNVFTKEIQFPFLLNEISKNNEDYCIEITGVVLETCFSCRVKSWTTVNERIILEKELVRSNDSSKILSYFVKAIQETRKILNKKKPELTVYEYLLKHPKAFGDNILIYKKRPKAMETDATDK
jgi:hypothetical protein